MSRPHITIRRTTRDAFTLIEIMVVVVILAILAAGVLTKVVGETDKARVSRAQSDIASITGSLERFRVHMGRYPTTEEGLDALKVQPEDDEEGKWGGPYVEKLGNDPWGRPYVYISPGDENPEGYDLLTYGADGVEGGESYDADIKHWTDETEEDAEPVSI